VTRFTDSAFLRQRQYCDASRLKARLALHERFGTNATRAAALRRHVQGVIERKGAFRITKDTGVLNATA
jgi:hypothetical protein